MEERGKDRNSRPSRGGKKEFGKSGKRPVRRPSKAGENRERPFRESKPPRLNQYIARAGVCSRREADELIASGKIKVNGKVVRELGIRVHRNDEVEFEGNVLQGEKPVYLLLNKPKGYLSTVSDDRGRKTVMDLVRKACRERIYPVGRLDRETTGLLLFTNDGDLAKKLTHPSSSIKKIYHVFLDKPFTPEHLEELEQGIELEDGHIRPDVANYVAEQPNGTELGVQLHSGQNRIVRRMFEHFGYKVMKLDRVLFANLTKKDLPRGKWRFLKDKEVTMLSQVVGKMKD